MVMDDLPKAVAYALRALGVESHPGDRPILRADDADIIEVRMRLPWRTESVKIDGLKALARPEALLDALITGRDRLFEATLAHIAEHDLDVRAMLEALKRSTDKRERILRVLAGQDAAT